MASSFSCPFNVLGISPCASQEEIKKVFRQRAIKLHPDKVPSEQRNQATRAFRELHEAYEQALEQSSDNFRASFSSREKNSKKKKQATDSTTKVIFDDICNELKRKRCVSACKIFESFRQEVQVVWPDKERCWKIARNTFLLCEIDELVEVLAASKCRDIASFFMKRKAQYLRDSDAEREKMLTIRVKRINEYWSTHKHKLKQWVESRELSTSEWDEIVERVENPK
eukprot:CAMPEP_0194149964 /NCGR_PEP_ID=MMETSP0152-20130528/40780_1 /TAXON_ID=1049557 /ORGANISM="Thalassiothrix antarctica, Strain L6-D1" /LENGTH=225 /DNA_ID=CAMNT_0038852539 /DNA_START=42 /DNA_END=716 /DNA_ORIENTATION=+